MNWTQVNIVARSTVQMVTYVGSTIVWALVAMLTIPLPYRQRYWWITRWTHFNLWVLERVCRIEVDVQGIEHIPPGGGIVLCKHQSTWETLALQRWFSPQTWVLKRELLRLPLFGWAISLLQPIAIDRGGAAKALRQLVQQGSERLSEGRWVVIFPEGTRMQPGQAGRYHLGGALLAERTGATVVPVAHNAGRFWGRGRFLKYPGVIQVRIGPPIHSDNRKAAEIMRLAEEWIEGQMRSIDAP